MVFRNIKNTAGTKTRALVTVLIFGIIGLVYLVVTNAAIASGPIVGIGSKCLDNYANLKKPGNRIQLYTCNKSAAQNWAIKDNLNIVNANGYCLTATGRLSKDLVTLNKCTNSDLQKWAYNTNSNTIVSAASGLCLDSQYGKSDDNNPIQIYTCNQTEAQVWKPLNEPVKLPTVTSFTATPSTLTAGSSTTLAWGTANATTCSVTPGGPTDTIATTWKSPALTTAGTVTYTLYCKNSTGATVSQSLVVTVNPAPVVSPSPAGWTPYYSTEFQNLDGWTVRDETQNNDNSRNIAANVIPASVANGKGLTIWGKRQSGYSVPYTSGEIHGKAPALVLPNYFRAEVVGTIMDESGLWPCLLWFRPNNASDGEIDVMEYMGGLFTGDQRRVAVTMHNEYGATQNSWKNPIYWKDLANPSITAKHTYTIEKTPGQIKVWMDGDERNAKYFGTTSLVTTAKKDWWNRIMEVPERTWYARITLQIGAGSVTKVVPNPAATWNESKMTVDSLKFWKMN